MQEKGVLQNVKLIPYPYSGKAGTGRGIDEYCNFIINSIQKKNFSRLDLVPTNLKKFSPFMIFISELGFMLKLRKVKGSVLHFLSPVGAKTAAFIGKKPYIVTINDVIPFMVKGFHPVRYFVLRRFIRISVIKASKVIVPFNYTKQFLIEKLNVPDSKIEVVNYWITNEDTITDPKKKSDKGNAVNKYIIFFGSHNAVVRGGDTAIRIFANIRKSYPDLSLKMVLKTNSKDYVVLMRLALALSVSDQVEFLDFMEEKQMNQEIIDAVAVLYPSRLGYGYIFTRSLMLGTPVISSLSLDMKNFEGHYDGLCVEDDVDCFSKTIRKIIEDQEFTKKIANQGNEILKSFNPDIAITKLISIYQHFL